MKFIKTLIFLLRQIGLNSLIKTIRFNVQYFGLKKGLVLPVLISKNVCFNKKSGKILIENFHTGVVKIGFGNVGIFDKKYDRTVLEFCGDATIIFDGSANIGHGSKISVQNSGILKFGNNFCITANSTIICTKEITFGHNCLLSWDILIMDSDLHKIVDKNASVLNEPRQIYVGNNVWIGARSTILKGVEIGSGNVIGANSLVTNSFKVEHSVIAGMPAKIIKSNVSWMR